MKTTAIVISLLVASVLFMGAFSGCGYSPEERADFMVNKIKNKLSLNGGQVERLEIVKNEILTFRQEMKADRNKIQVVISEMINQPKLDQERILSVVREKTQKINEKAPQMMVALAGFYDSLTPEQQKIIKEKVEDHMEHSEHSWKHN